MGFDEDSFWQMTPRQIDRIVVARNEIMISEYNDRAWLAWHIAALPRAKKFPALKTMLHKVPKPRQTWQEQLAIARMWAAVTPGSSKIYKTDEDKN